MMKKMLTTAAIGVLAATVVSACSSDKDGSADSSVYNVATRANNIVGKVSKCSPDDLSVTKTTVMSNGGQESAEVRKDQSGAKYEWAIVDTPWITDGAFEIIRDANTGTGDMKVAYEMAPKSATICEVSILGFAQGDSIVGTSWSGNIDRPMTVNVTVPAMK